jgi:prepilin-type N-terminal cleavage/methylation domain-containing protein
MKTSPLPESRNGYSMIEILLALTIFSVGLLAVASLQIGAQRGGRSAVDSTEAAVLAMDRLERLLAMDFSDANLVDVDGDGLAGINDASAAAADQNTTDPSGKYNLFWNVADNTPTPNAKTIRVIVTWNRTMSGTGTPGRLFMNAVKARNL